ncbi:hypothetical protein BESB_047530 [Besnoitia besnoiti]|uniref:Uncharacterized protein n=1 Tax=Besnoitia besnoiti TaxID=94643 RepID=A0A2A9MJY0_BESBE|nr:hypothetical protein BESB_047530 [Besnoitia besnoiti]PFH36561.1 hypothetical protein BESB_047530 [Besnoitia besnoiti]
MWTSISLGATSALPVAPSPGTLEPHSPDPRGDVPLHAVEGREGAAEKLIHAPSGNAYVAGTRVSRESDAAKRQGSCISALPDFFTTRPIVFREVDMHSTAAQPPAFLPHRDCIVHIKPAPVNDESWSQTGTFPRGLFSPVFIQNIDRNTTEEGLSGLTDTPICSPSFGGLSEEGTPRLTREAAAGAGAAELSTAASSVFSAESPGLLTLDVGYYSGRKSILSEAREEGLSEAGSEKSLSTCFNVKQASRDQLCLPVAVALAVSNVVESSSHSSFRDATNAGASPPPPAGTRSARSLVRRLRALEEPASRQREKNTTDGISPPSERVEGILGATRARDAVRLRLERRLSTVKAPAAPTSVSSTLAPAAPTGSPLFSSRGHQPPLHERQGPSPVRRHCSAHRPSPSVDGDDEDQSACPPSLPESPRRSRGHCHGAVFGPRVKAAARLVALLLLCTCPLILAGVVFHVSPDSRPVALSLLDGLCPLSSFCVYVAPAGAALTSIKNRTTQHLPALLFVLQALCNLLGCAYGLALGSAALAATNFIGLAFQVLWLAVYLALRRYQALASRSAPVRADQGGTHDEADPDALRCGRPRPLSPLLAFPGRRDSRRSPASTGREPLHSAGVPPWTRSQCGTLRKLVSGAASEPPRSSEHGLVTIWADAYPSRRVSHCGAGSPYYRGLVSAYLGAEESPGSRAARAACGSTSPVLLCGKLASKSQSQRTAEYAALGNDHVAARGQGDTAPREGQRRGAPWRAAAEREGNREAFASVQRVYPLPASSSDVPSLRQSRAACVLVVGDRHKAEAVALPHLHDVSPWRGSSFLALAVGSEERLSPRRSWRRHSPSAAARDAFCGGEEARPPFRRKDSFRSDEALPLSAESRDRVEDCGRAVSSSEEHHGSMPASSLVGSGSSLRCHSHPTSPSWMRSPRSRSPATGGAVKEDMSQTAGCASPERAGKRWMRTGGASSNARRNQETVQLLLRGPAGDGGDRGVRQWEGKPLCVPILGAFARVAVTLAPVFVVSTFLHESWLALLLTLLNVLAVVSPLSLLGDMIRRRSSTGLPRPLVAMMVVCNGLWGLYGLAGDIPAVYISSVIGYVAGFLQLAVVMWCDRELCWIDFALLLHLLRFARVSYSICPALAACNAYPAISCGHASPGSLSCHWSRKGLQHWLMKTGDDDGAKLAAEDGLSLKGDEKQAVALAPGKA